MSRRRLLMGVGVAALAAACLAGCGRADPWSVLTFGPDETFYADQDVEADEDDVASNSDVNDDAQDAD